MKKFILLLSCVFLINSCSKEPEMYTLNIVSNPPEGGIFSPNGGTVNAGDQITVTQTPNQEFIFKNWTGAASGSSNTVTVIMDSDKTLTANYLKIKYSLTTSVEGEGTISEKTIKAGVVTDYNSGTIVELTAIPSPEWEFVEWSGDLTGSENPKQITINSSKSVKAKFKISNPFYLDENGVTVKAKDGVIVGEEGKLNGITYKAVDKSTLQSMIYKNEDVSKVVTTLITDMEQLLYINRDDSVRKAFDQDISSWDVSNVTTMESLFSGAEIFNQDISNWDVSEVVNMKLMFMSSKTFNQDIGNWDVSNVTNMAGMFQQSKFEKDISNWDVSNVTNMSGIFSNAYFNGDLSNWDVSKVTDMSGAFDCMQKQAPCFNNDSISNWDVSSVTNMIMMFYESPFNHSLNNWDVSSVKDMRMMFKYSKFNSDISDWDVSNVTNMSSMFEESVFNKPIGDWNVFKVRDDRSNNNSMEGMNYMFFNSINFNQDISRWCVLYLKNIDNFSTNSPLEDSKKPVWGTCPGDSYSISVSASSNSDYTLVGKDKNGDVQGNDPTLTFKVGDEITFSVNATGHPFYLQYEAGLGTGNRLDISNNGTTNGSIKWKPNNTGTYYYQCSSHRDMVGTINVE